MLLRARNFNIIGCLSVRTLVGIFSKRWLNRKTVDLSQKDPKEEQCDVPHEEEEGGSDPNLFNFFIVLCDQ